MSDPTIQLSLSAYDALRKRTEGLAERVTTLEQALLEARTATPEVKLQLTVIDDALTIVRFAVANLPVENVRNWPHDELARLADALVLLPGRDDQPTRELAAALRSRAAELAAYAESRAAAAVELRRALAAGMPVGLLCAQCRKPQLAHAEGARCADGHVVEGVPPETPSDYDALAEAYERV